jgi:membrane protease YdiL (CAAX protease family)
MKPVPIDKFLQKPKPQPGLERVLRFPLVELVLVVLFMAPVAIAHNLTAEHFLEKLAEPYNVYLGYLEKIVNFALFILVYRLYVRWVEKRRAVETGFEAGVQETGVGFLIGGGLVAVMVLFFSVSGYYGIESFNENPRVLLDTFFARGIGAFVEELFVRLILFRLLEELLGSWYALAVVALIFGLGHFPNPNATLWTSAAIALSDILLTAAFILTRRLWMAWGIHFGWNYIQNSVFGMANSGVTQLDSWINPSISGPEALTGGSFGIEASYVAVALQIALGVWLLKLDINRKQIVRPVWKRKQFETSADTAAG